MDQPLRYQGLMTPGAAPLGVFCSPNALTHTGPVTSLAGSTRRVSPAPQRGEGRAPA